MYNINGGYGKLQMGLNHFTLGKVFVVSDNTDVNFNYIDELFQADPEGITRRYSSVTAALAATVAGRGDIIILSPAYTTALTAADLLAAETNGVTIVTGGKTVNGNNVEHRALATLPQTAQSALFTVTGRIKLIAIIGEVTTAIQNQANNTKLVSNPTVGADVDLCAVTSIANAAVGTQLSITGTLANGLVVTPSGALVFQAAPLLIMPGTIDLSCAASNTGAVKWKILYQPIDPGARVFAA